MYIITSYLDYNTRTCILHALTAGETFSLGPAALAWHDILHVAIKCILKNGLKREVVK